MKTKSEGKFDYHYVPAQFHKEQFHMDEKHGSKYGADSHDVGQKYHGDGYYADKAYDKYGKESVIPTETTDDEASYFSQETTCIVRS